MKRRKQQILCLMVWLATTAFCNGMRCLNSIKYNSILREGADLGAPSACSQLLNLAHYLYCAGQQQLNSSNSCVQASTPFVCCLIGGPECFLDSGCSCDRTCYDRGDCCVDIVQIGCLGKCQCDEYTCNYDNVLLLKHVPSIICPL